MNEKEYNFNVNDYVKVKLTEKGKEFLNKKRPWYIKEYLDSDDFVKFQLWDLMSFFGEEIYGGCDNPFETTIKIIPSLMTND